MNNNRFMWFKIDFFYVFKPFQKDHSHIMINYYYYQKNFHPKKILWGWSCHQSQPDLATWLSWSPIQWTQLDGAPHQIDMPSMQPNFWIRGLVLVLRRQPPRKVSLMEWGWGLGMHFIYNDSWKIKLREILIFMLNILFIKLCKISLNMWFLFFPLLFIKIIFNKSIL